MTNLKVLVIISLTILIQIVCEKSDNEDTLVMVNIIFRHGNRTIDEFTRYPNDPYTDDHYYPYGVGQLTNEGKRRMYLLGKELRKRYNHFLDDTFTSDVIYARTSDYDRTKASLMLLLAGLFPPTEMLKWDDDLHWNPIPFEYVKKSDDMDFSAFYSPAFRNLLQKHTSSKEYQAKIQNDTYLMKYVEQHAGKPIRNYIQLTAVANCLITQDELGFALPAWTKSIYPETLKHYHRLGYLEAVSTKEMVQLCGGHMLNAILRDTFAKIDGKLPKGRKMHLHSGHDINLVCMLKLFGIFEPHTPSYAAHLLIELHNINDVYGFKIYYQNEYLGPVIQKLPNCDGTFCKLDTFVNLYKSYLPN